MFLKKLKYLRVSVRIRWIGQVDWCSVDKDASIVPNCHGEDGAEPEGEALVLLFNLRSNPHPWS